ncbi:CBS pair associated ParBc domain-containing protein [Methanospirillum sp.]|uniref:CBS pair associated ParBc domain-containing protein n=1 Tax=Methanospirillum sp. TaxID=45200 RepID=UPI0035A0F5E3
MEKKRVRDYMTTDVDTVPMTGTAREVIQVIRNTSHDGFPVVDGNIVVGYIAARDLLFVHPDTPVREIMSHHLIVADPEMAISDVARVIIRSGIQKLPVVNEKNELLGIISNTDVVRSQIEHVSPEKVYKLMDTIERLHDIKPYLTKGPVQVNTLLPTQSRIYMDELEGRIYEIKKGLAEPVIVIKKPSRHLLVDGHHRSVAARRLGIKILEAYIIEIRENIELGLERTAKALNLKSIDDILIMDYARHPLIAGTHRYGAMGTVIPDYQDPSHRVS